jgi:hypothetical protein
MHMTMRMHAATLEAGSLSDFLSGQGGGDATT